jgi:hypothetical protein
MLIIPGMSIGFSHLFVLWVFDRAGWTGELVGAPAAVSTRP